MAAAAVRRTQPVDLGVAAAGDAATLAGGDPEIDRIAAANGRGSRGADVTTMQQRLTDAGYDTQGVDGKWGPDTQAAYDQYRAAHPLPVQQGTGYTVYSGAFLLAMVPHAVITVSLATAVRS